MDELQSLQHQLEEARDEAELNLLQLQQVQEELEFYFLRCQELEQARQASDAEAASPQPSQQEREALIQERDDAIRQAEQNAALLSTAQRMLEGQARYLEDVSRREEQAAQALDRIRLLEAEILYYIQNSKPLPGLDPGRINRLIQLAKQADAAKHPVGRP